MSEADMWRWLFNVVIFLALVALLGIPLWALCSRQMSQRETGFLGLFVAVLGMVVTWYVSHVYASIERKHAVEEVREFHERRLKTYALNAVQKVENLSVQLRGVAAGIDGTLAEAQGEGLTADLMRERLRSVHDAISILQSMNDTFVTDWRGVIGEELKREEAIQAELAEARRALLREMRDREVLQRSLLHEERVTPMMHEVREREALLRKRIVELSAQATFPRLERPRLGAHWVSVDCPACGETGEARASRSKRGRRFHCAKCGRYSIVKLAPDGALELALVPEVAGTVKCPLCGQTGEFPVADEPGLVSRVKCGRCDHVFGVTMGAGDELQVQPGPRVEPTDKFVRLLRDEISTLEPDGGEMKQAAERIGCSVHMVTRAVNAARAEAGLEPLRPRATAPAGKDGTSAEAATEPNAKDGDVLGNDRHE